MSPRTRYKLELFGSCVLLAVTILGGLAAMFLI